VTDLRQDQDRAADANGTAGEAPSPARTGSPAAVPRASSRRNRVAIAGDDRPDLGVPLFGYGVVSVLTVAERSASVEGAA